ncbi:MAG: deoxyhypusine synthase [Phycisphaeraceae bacterium]
MTTPEPSNHALGPVPTKAELLARPIQHIDITQHDPTDLIEAMSHMAYSSRDLARAAGIYDMMLRDRDCAIVLTLAGSLVSAGLKKVFADLIRFNMVDAIVSTGANVVDQDFFEGLGFKHYIADERYKSGMDDQALRELNIDRIYDTFIDEDNLRECDEVMRQISDSLEPRPHSSREFIHAMGRYLAERNVDPADSMVRAAYEHDVPIFCPAFSDCSAGFGLVAHQHEKLQAGQPMLSLDSAKDFYELTQVKLKHPTTGIFMLGGGVPKNFTQDIVVAAEVLGYEVDMHKYAVQVTVADVRDGALSSSTLKEACSWGKVDTAYEQMVYAEATLATPLIAGYGYHKQAWKDRTARRCNEIFQPAGSR